MMAAHWPCICPTPCSVHPGSGRQLSSQVNAIISSLNTGQASHQCQSATPWTMGCVGVSMDAVGITGKCCASITGRAAPVWHSMDCIEFRIVLSL